MRRPTDALLALLVPDRRELDPPLSIRNPRLRTGLFTKISTLFVKRSSVRELRYVAAQYNSNEGTPAHEIAGAGQPRLAPRSL
eukprot:7657716-Pyramimonas_sp.AAC.1